MPWVLVVDSDPDTLQTIAAVVRRVSGWDAVCATDAQQALLLLETVAFDSVLCSQSLDGMDGEEVLAVAASLQPGTRRVLFASRATFHDPAFGVVRKPDGLRAIAAALGSVHPAPPLGVRA